jgi:predicted AlkP superfamily phosphohydrolase/phosphomutase
MFRKTFVLGIDSGCWDYLDPLLAAGRMPNLSRLIRTGIRGILESTMPPITPVAFSSFAIGVNPGKHGIFGWSVRPGGQAQSVPASASNRKGEPFWRYLNAAGVLDY